MVSIAIAEAYALAYGWARNPNPNNSHKSLRNRLAYVIDGVCVVRYDNEVGKGDHRHFGAKESSYSFKTTDRLIADFQRDIARWNRENSDS